jgi:hypothetical protein
MEKHAKCAPYIFYFPVLYVKNPDDDIIHAVVALNSLTKVLPT